MEANVTFAVESNNNRQANSLYVNLMTNISVGIDAELSKVK